LGELKPISGKVEVKGRLSYVSQEPWMFMGTIRDNILFGMAYDSAWYNKVIEACSLDEVIQLKLKKMVYYSLSVQDFNQLPYGDLTLVGERGVTLSGGQKARVNLARAVYHDADIFLLDDPLSAVDATVAAHLFNKFV
jgi:ATP-binding cassette subfamily C (CFTR/MRP) protein 4